MLQHLLERTAVAAADDQDVPRRPVRHDRHMADHLVIDELVTLGDLHEAIQHEDAAQERRLEDNRLLVRGAPPIDVPFDFEPLAPMWSVGFLVPLAHHSTPRICSQTVIRRALNMCRSTGTTLCGSADPHMKASIAA